MSYFKLIIRKAFSGKHRSLIICSVVFFILGIAFSVFPEYPSPFHGSLTTIYFRTISNILLGIGASFFAASLITTIQSVDFARVSKLRELFSLNHKRKIAIVFPQFTNDVLLKTFLERLPDGIVDAETARKIAEGAKNNPQNKNHASYVGYADFDVVKSLVALLQANHIELPEIITDKEAIAISSDPNRLKQYGTIISVGLFSNDFSAKINQDKKLNDVAVESFFSFENRDHAHPENRKIKLQEVVGKKATEDREHSPQTKSLCDLCLFTKMTFAKEGKRKTTVIICGGLSASGTSAFGKYLYYKWEKEICELKGRNIENELKLIRKTDNFAVLYEVIGQCKVHFDPDAYLKDDPLARVG